MPRVYAARSLRCPTAPRRADGSPHTIIGCGSANVTTPDAEGIVDCCDCGIWFTPTAEKDSAPVVHSPAEL